MIEIIEPIFTDSDYGNIVILLLAIELFIVTFMVVQSPIYTRKSRLFFRNKLNIIHNSTMKSRELHVEIKKGKEN